MWDTISRKLNSQIDGSSLALFRICFGLAVCWSTFKYITPDAVAFQVNYVIPEWNFPYVGWEWVKPFPPAILKLVFIAIFVSSFTLAIGIFYRVSAVILFLTYTYTFLLESSLFNNHFYLISLFSFLMIWLPADQQFSISSFRKAKDHSSSQVPYWSVFILRFQLLIVYVYGGIAKFNGDFLSGEAIIGSAEIFKTQIANFIPAADPIPVIFIASSMAWIGLFFDLFISFILWCRKTQWIGLILLGAFHLINHITLPIGVFPFLGFAASLIFLAPDWPKSTWKWICQKFSKSPDPCDARVKTKNTKPSPAPKYVMYFIASWVLFQTLLPLRHFFIPGDASWTEEGQNYAWRMMLRQKLGGSLIFHMYDDGLYEPGSKKTKIDWSKAPGPIPCKGVFIGVDAYKFEWYPNRGINTLYENVLGFRIIQAVKATNKDAEETEIRKLKTWWKKQTGTEGLFVEALPIEECIQNALDRLKQNKDKDAISIINMVQLAQLMVDQAKEQEGTEARKSLLSASDLLYMATQTKFGDILRAELTKMKPFELLGIRTNQKFYVLAESTEAEEIQDLSDKLNRGDHYIVWCDFEKLRNHGWKGLPDWFVVFESGELVILSNYFTKFNLRQSENLITKPYMMHQYAQREANKWEEQTGRRPKVYAFGSVMMNYRQPQALFRADVDLASTPYHIWRHNDWILPLETERIGIAERVEKEQQRMRELRNKVQQ